VSYHVSILRTTGKRTVAITPEDVQSLAREFPGWTYDVGRKTLASEAEDGVALWLSNSELWTKNPSEATLGVMLQFATRLGARVRGDELETYRTATETYLHPDDAAAKAKANTDTRALIRRTRLKSLALHAAIFGSFALLILLFAKLGFIR
jgi:hypothetical protein